MPPRPAVRPCRGAGRELCREDDYPTTGVFALRRRVDAADVRDDVVDDLAISGVHRFERTFLTRGGDVGRNLLRELGQRLPPPLAVARDVDMYPGAVAAGVVMHDGPHDLLES